MGKFDPAATNADTFTDADGNTHLIAKSDARSLADVCFPDGERFGVAHSFAERHGVFVPDDLATPLAFALTRRFRMNSAERLRETEEFLCAKIPLTRAMQVRVEGYDKSGLVLTAPLAANHNHLGTAFGGSLAALVMLAGYALLWLESKIAPRTS